MLCNIITWGPHSSYTRDKVGLIDWGKNGIIAVSLGTESRCGATAHASQVGSDESLTLPAAQGSDNPEAKNCLRLPSESSPKTKSQRLASQCDFPSPLSDNLISNSSNKRHSNYFVPLSLGIICMALVIQQLRCHDGGTRTPLSSVMVSGP